MENTNVPETQQKTQEDYRRKINAVRKVVADGASDEEFEMFISLAIKYDLDPFAREIWCIKRTNQTHAIITTSRDGYLKIANRNEHYRGLESDVIYSGDKFFKDEQGVHHSYNLANRGKPIGAYALVYRDDRMKPAYAFAPFSEYFNGKSPTWQDYPHAMILKVAESMALKRAFSVSGLVAKEELNGNDDAQDVQQQQPKQELQKAPNPPSPRPSTLKELWERYLAVCDGQKQHAANAMKKITGKENSKDFTDEDIQKLEEDVSRREYEAMNKELQTPSELSDFQDADFQEV